MNFLILLFTLFSIISFYDIDNIKFNDNMIEIKYLTQLIMNIIIFTFSIFLLKDTVILTLDYNKIKNDMNKFINKEDNIDEDNPNFKPIEFKYISLEGNVCSIIEYRNINLQRYLFYSSENAQENIDENNKRISEIQLNLQENIQKNNQDNTLNVQNKTQLNPEEKSQDNNIDKNSKISN